MNTKSSLEQQRHQHLDNIVILEGQASNYGHEVPLHIATNLQNERAKVKEIEVELDLLEQEIATIATSPTNNNMTEDRLKRVEASLDRIVVDIGEIKTTLAVLETRVAHAETDDSPSIPPWVIQLGTVAFLTVAIIAMILLIIPIV